MWPRLICADGAVPNGSCAALRQLQCGRALIWRGWSDRIEFMRIALVRFNVAALPDLARMAGALVGSRGGVSCVPFNVAAPDLARMGVNREGVAQIHWRFNVAALIWRGWSAWSSQASHFSIASMWPR